VRTKKILERRVDSTQVLATLPRSRFGACETFAGNAGGSLIFDNMVENVSL